MSLEPRLPSHAVEAIHQFLRAHVRDAGASGLTVGLSGGIDSALMARLARDALGAGAVHGVLLPSPKSPDGVRTETLGYARSIGIEAAVVPLDRLVDGLHATVPELTDRIALGNATARLRMTVLYALSRERGTLVAGTGNKTELLLGYFTKYGDGGVDLHPLGDLYKTDIRALARQLELPPEIQQRPPSAGFWEGQTDEGELGLTYETIDRILYGFEQLRTAEEVAELTGADLAAVRALAERVAHNRHKRVPIPIPKLRLRTVGIDWRD
ncbi:MAG TPA: NAD+ synthase [Thermoplasmata archaeon]|nr:NAD+ synthase [Thermoplasmata archaeon]